MDEAWLRLAGCYIGRPRFDAVRAHAAFDQISASGELAKGAAYERTAKKVKYFWDTHNRRPWEFVAADAWLILKLSLRARHGPMLDKNHGDDSYLISLLDIVSNPGERLVAMPAKLERIGGHDPLSQAIAGIGYLNTQQPEKARPYLKRVIELGGTGFAELDSMLPRLLDVAPVLPRP